MAAPEFIVLKTTLDSIESNKLFESTTTGLNKNGFVQNTPAYASEVNAIMHETSLITTALAQNIGNITPISDLATVKTAIGTYIASVKSDEADTADKVGHMCYLAMNTTDFASAACKKFNGSENVNVGPIFGPTTAGTRYAIAVSTETGAPVWEKLYAKYYLGSNVYYECLYTTARNGIYIFNPNTQSICNFTVSGKMVAAKSEEANGRASTAATGGLIVNGGVSIGYVLSTESGGDQKKAINVAADNFYVKCSGEVVTASTITSASSITALSFVATSDRRLKKNITDYQSKKSILDLQVKEFDFISDGSHHIGCIAQDLQEIAPELVHEDKDGYLAIEESKIVYLLLNEIKKLRKEIDEMKGSK